MFALIVFLPLIAAAAVGLRCSKISHGHAQLLASGTLVLAAILAWIAFFMTQLQGYEAVTPLMRWINSGGLQVGWDMRLDKLSASMMILVTTVSAVVHIYSIGYMHHDPHVPRFMAYLSLFTFFMLLLVTSENFLQLFVGWEGVGLCSYLLIGFWFKKESANKASLKAFLVNRVADAFFVLGICAVFVTFDSLSFTDVFAKTQELADKRLLFFGHSFHAMTLISMLLFIGAMGKSAQLGLHTWLPDAMEGPTPVSALIHAATMVTAGVFLLARCSFIFELAPATLAVVTVVGALTALFAATIAVTQNDIKRVIAYSTCSQLGYMFFACGVSAYSGAMFHLITHGFFKALLFLCAGNVIHAMSDEQDMRRMGGLRKYLPKTHAMFLIGSLALVGVFPFAGYYSKDLILETAYASGGVGRFAFYMGLTAAFLTAFYSARALTLTFYGETRAPEKTLSHAHEAPNVMNVPLYLLTFGAVFAGAAGYYLLDVGNPDHHFWHGAVSLAGRAEEALHGAHGVPTQVKFAPLVVGAVGLALGYFLYQDGGRTPAVFARTMPILYNVSYRKWYVDEIYDAVFVKPSFVLASICWKILDVAGIDRFGPNGAAAISASSSRVASRAQTGYIFDYALMMLFGLAICLGLASLSAAQVGFWVR
ncbi:MAG: NADH-quinone oxidoreductase subunit L [Rickettsiales bacterium]